MPTTPKTGKKLPTWVYLIAAGGGILLALMLNRGSSSDTPQDLTDTGAGDNMGIDASGMTGGGASGGPLPVPQQLDALGLTPAVSEQAAGETGPTPSNWLNTSGLAAHVAAQYTPNVGTTGLASKVAAASSPAYNQANAFAGTLSNAIARANNPQPVRGPAGGV